MKCEVIGMLDWKCKQVMKQRIAVDAFIIANRISSSPKKLKQLMDDLKK